MSTNKLKVSYDPHYHLEKPSQDEIRKINNRIGKSVHEIELRPRDMWDFIDGVSRDGHTFCPATFKDGKRGKENFEQQQLIALDFDNKDPDNRVSFEDVKARAEHYDLPILFAYDTLSSRNHDKFRVVFLNDVSIPDRKVAEAMQLAMGTIFPEADQSCVNDVSRMYFGGDKEILHFDKQISQINIASLFMGLSYYMKEKYGDKHYKKHIASFSEKTGIRRNKKGFLDVTVSEIPTELSGVTEINNNGGNSPHSIIYTLNTNIKGNGEIPPDKYYCINLIDDTNGSSVGKDDKSKAHKNHKPYRKLTIDEMSQKCQLFSEFESCVRIFHHNELFGLFTNMRQVETGESTFMKLIRKYSDFDTSEKSKLDKWDIAMFYMKQQEYHPQSCDGFCPYHEICEHGTNILSTVHLKRGEMDKLPGYSVDFYSIEEVQDDTYNAINEAFCANDTQIHIVKSMTGGGKSTSYLRIMSENPDDNFIVAAPTNLLKDELYRKAKKMGINVRKTPSLEELKDEIPEKVWKYIQSLYKRGQHDSVHPYIRKQLKNKNIPCLKKYMEERDSLKEFEGSIFTTHRYLLNMDRKRLSEYSAVIIDEDIIFKSIISNQGEIIISRLEELMEETDNKSLSKKIRKLLEFSKERSCIKLDSCKFKKSDFEDDGSIPFDIPSFCRTKRFYVRRKSKDDKLKEDTITFLKPATFFKDIKYIMVSATVNETVCRRYFGEDRVEFYECKKAGYQGTLNQYTQKSMSRTSLASNPGVIPRLMKHFNIDEDKVITFLRENIGNLHFGNTEGSNTLEGEDILVVGTPYHADFLYKLVAFTMGIAFDEDEEMESQLVMHNGYRFWFTTFEDKDLRAIHFWMLESELEQAVGRARLLRNTCEVHLFSNFPISQAKIITNFDYDKE